MARLYDAKLKGVWHNQFKLAVRKKWDLPLLWQMSTSILNRPCGISVGSTTYTSRNRDSATLREHNMEPSRHPNYNGSYHLPSKDEKNFATGFGRNNDTKDLKTRQNILWSPVVLPSVNAVRLTPVVKQMFYNNAFLRLHDCYWRRYYPHCVAVARVMLRCSCAEAVTLHDGGTRRSSNIHTLSAAARSREYWQPVSFAAFANVAASQCRFVTGMRIRVRALLRHLLTHIAC